MLARLRARVSATLDVTKADVEPLLRDGSVPGQAWDAMIAAARSVQAHDVAVYWSTRGSGSTGSVARRFFFECIQAAQHALADRDVDTALRAVEETREDDTRIEGNDEFCAEAVPLASKALGTARRYRSNMAFRNGALALCRLAESRSALGEPDARETAQQALDALRAEFEELDAVRREVEPRLLRILGLDT